MREYDLVCIGCGPAGEKAATQAAYFGHRVAVVERAPRPGGAMVNTGTIPSKALRETALICSSLRRRPIPGLSLETRALTMARLMARKNLVEIQEHDRIEASFDRHGIQVHRGVGRIVDPHTVSVETGDGQTERLRTKFILIATGSSPLRPSNIAFNHPVIVDADGVLQLDRLPGTMVVVGGGVIGCEYACVFAELGVSVTLIEPRASLLPFVDADCLECLMAAMRDMEIDVRLNTKVAAAEVTSDGRAAIELQGASPIRCDVLLWAAGRMANTADLGLESVGLTTNDRGCIPVNQSYQTAVPSIYAAGDAVGNPALASTSMEQARIAACHMFTIDFKKKLAEMFPYGLYTIPPIAMVGLGEADARKAGHDVVVGKAPYRQNSRGRMLGDEQGLLKLTFDRSTRRLLGVVMIGELATELIHIGQSMLVADATIDDFIQACFTYPSLSELYKYAAYGALQSMAADRKTSPSQAVARAKAA
jgi:NAD(P) transhydrogenase